MLHRARLALASLLALALACQDKDKDGETGASSMTAAETAAETAASDCGSFRLVPEFTPSNLMLLVDTSRSMLELWDHDGDPSTPEVTRWASALHVINEIVAAYNQFSRLGVQRFPAQEACGSGVCSDADVCLVGATPELGLGDGAGPDLLATLPEVGTTDFAGASPARAAFASARAELLAAPPSPNTIVLISDGEANCSEGSTLPASFEVHDAMLAPAVEGAYVLDSIQTIVVGLDIVDTDQGPGPGQDRPALNPFEALNELALVGGSPWEGGVHEQKFYGLAQLDAIVHALTGPTTLSECIVELEYTEVGLPTPEQIGLVEIILNAQPVPFVEDCATGEGWTWLVSGEVLTMCGSYCDTMMHDLVELEGIYGCA